MSSKLRSFLKRHLSADVYSDVRWCEAVILRLKNRVTFCHVAVTSDSVYVADLASRSLRVLLTIKNITSLQLVADKVEFLSGVVQQQSSHLVVTIAAPTAAKSLVAQSSSVLSEARKGGWDCAPRVTDDYGSLDSVVRASDPASRSPRDEWRKRGSFSEGSDSVSQKTSSLKRSKRKISSFFKGLWRGKSYSSSQFQIGNSSDLPATYNPALLTTSSGLHSYQPANSSSTLPFSVATSCGDLTDRRPSLMSMNSTFQEFSPGQKLFSEPQSPRPHTQSSDAVSNGLDVTTKSPFLAQSDQFNFDSDTSERKISPPILQRASSCQSLESGWGNRLPTLHVSGVTSRRDATEVEGPDGRHLRRSASAQDTRGTPVPLFPRSYSVLGAPVHASSRRGSLINSTAEGEEKVHLYTITANSLLHQLLYTLWRNKRLRGRKQSDDPMISARLLPASSPKSSDAKVSYQPSAPSSVEEGFWQLKTELLAAETLDECYLLTKELSSGLAKVSKLKVLFWQDTSFLNRLLSLLSQYLALNPQKISDESEKQKRRFAKNGDFGNSSQEQRQEELELCVLLYNALLESFYDAHKPMVKMLSLSDYKLTCQVLATVLTPAALPNSLRLTCDRWLTDVAAYSDDTIRHLPCAPVAQLVVRCTELSIVSVHKLLLALSEDVNSSPHLCNIFKSCHVKPWLRYAVPLMVASMRGARRTTYLHHTPDVTDEVETLQVHLSVLSALLDNSTRTQRFCIRHYKEEIKYYVTAEQVASLMEGYADSATVEMCVALAENIRFRLAL
ncbi:uncharacterized protein LOC108671200 [Hyalella azteca]|uniref:Uncharacterized protein LOC108671200 n=1 Tax=Hyalella azteca TaxID=294128 RepID=A0A8B7NKK1_HYAAZ|nr:uncharacterized protein LOC108671200 [Hyalella azteca]